MDLNNVMTFESGGKKKKCKGSQDLHIAGAIITHIAHFDKVLTSECPVSL